MSDGDVERLITETLESTPAGATHWSTRSMAAHLGTSQSTVSRVWRAFGLAPHNQRSNREWLARSVPPAILDWLDRHPRFHLHFTPTGSSWINQVERWFGLLTDQLIRRGVHKSVVALEHDVREWMRNWNQDPRPFVWTKTAEDILQSLSKYIAKISDAGH